MMEQAKDVFLSNRETMIYSIRIICVLDAPFGNTVAKRLGFDDNAWQAEIETKTGLDEPDFSLHFFPNKQAAEKFLADHPVGTIVPDKPISINLLEAVKAGQNPNVVFDVDEDGFHPRCYDALVAAGVIDKRTFSTSQTVLDSFSAEEQEVMQEHFGENWGAAVELEYVLKRFPRTSLASYAAKIFYSYFITNDDFAVGYLWREMKMLLSRVEDLAIGANETRSKAGRAGGLASTSNKNRRLDAFMLEIEKLKDLYPTISEQRIVDTAFENAIAADSELWNEGRGQKEDYLSKSIRSCEPYKSRYWSIFDRTT